MRATGRPTFGSNWLAGLVLGAVNGAAMLSLGVLIAPLLLVSVVLILWKGPRLTAGAGFLTGAGVVWTVLFLRIALACGVPLDPETSSCTGGDMTGWVLAAAAMFCAGLAGSAFALRRSTAE